MCRQVEVAHIVTPNHVSCPLLTTNNPPPYNQTGAGDASLVVVTDNFVYNVDDDGDF